MILRALLLASFVLLSSRPAVAEDELSALSRNAEAVAAGRAGLEAYERGEWDIAHRHFESAELLAHSPVFVLHMARAQRNFGEWLEAQRLYERVAMEPLSADAPDAWRQAVVAARAERTELTEQLPSIIVVFASGGPGDGALTLDGSPFLRLGEEVFADPGTHVLVFRRADGTESRQAFMLVPGQKRALVTLAAPARVTQPKERPASDARALQHAPAAPSPPPASGRSKLAYAAGGVGLAGFLVGVAAGTLAWNELRQIKTGCDGRRCNPRDRERLDSVRRLGTVSDIGFAAGAAGLGTSAVLLWIVPEPAPGKAALNGFAFGARYRY